jgi:hypothetical protein
MGTLHSGLKERAHVVRFDAAFQAFYSIYGDDWDAVAIALEERWVTAYINLVERDAEVGGGIVQMGACVVAEVAAGFAVENDAGHHGRLLAAAAHADGHWARATATGEASIASTIASS